MHRGFTFLLFVVANQCKSVGFTQQVRPNLKPDIVVEEGVRVPGLVEAAEVGLQVEVVQDLPELVAARKLLKQRQQQKGREGVQGRPGERFHMARARLKARGPSNSHLLKAALDLKPTLVEPSSQELRHPASRSRARRFQMPIGVFVPIAWSPYPVRAFSGRVVQAGLSRSRCLTVHMCFACARLSRDCRPDSLLRLRASCRRALRDLQRAMGSQIA